METLLYWFGAWAMLCGGFWFIFERIEKVSTKKLRDAASMLFTLPYGELVIHLPDRFIELFDYLFGEKHFSWKRIWRSAIASIAFVVIIWLILSSGIRPAQSSDNSITPLGAIFGSVTSIFLAAVVFNLFPDYFSLGKTRYLLKRMSTRIKGSGLMRLAGKSLCFITIDLTLTFLIFCVFLLILDFLLGLKYTGLNIDLIIECVDYIPEVCTIVFLTIVRPSSIFPETYLFQLPLAIFIYTTFFTSGWICLYTLSVTAVKLMLPFIDGFENILPYFSYRKRPFRTIGLFTNLIITAIFIAIGIVKLVKVIAS